MAVRRDCIGCVVTIGRFEFFRELWFVVFQEGCVKGAGDCDVLFAVSFLCRVERRRGIVLGSNNNGQVMLVAVVEGAVGLLRGRCMAG